MALRLYEQLVSDNEGSGKAKLTLARLYENTGDLKKAGGAVRGSLQANANSVCRVARSGSHRRSGEAAA